MLYKSMSIEEPEKILEEANQFSRQNKINFTIDFPFSFESIDSKNKLKRNAFQIDV